MLRNQIMGYLYFNNSMIKKFLKRFKMTKWKPTSTLIVTWKMLSKHDKGTSEDPTLYKILVGHFIYLTTKRWNIRYGVNLISRFMEIPKISQWQIGKIILRYILGTTNFGILYSTTNSISLLGYTKNYFAGNIDNRNITSGYAFHLGLRLISWLSKK